MNKTILITGGAGYIGSYVNKLLLKENYNTLILDDLSRGTQNAIVGGELIIGDFGDEKLLENLFSNHPIEAVLHFAAWTDVGESVKNPFKYYENNVIKSFTLLKKMVEHGIKNFIFSSSAAIFGLPKEQKVEEESPKAPINPYGETKLIVEKLLHDASVAYGLKYCSLRYFNAAGADPEGEIPIHLEKMTNLIPVILRNAQEKKATTIFGSDYPTRDGTCIRDFIHIHDLGVAHVLALHYLLEGGTSVCLNLGNGEGITVLEVLEAAEKLLPKQIFHTLGPKRAGDPPTLLSESTKAKALLHWEPIYPSIETILQHAVQSVALKWVH